MDENIHYPIDDLQTTATTQGKSLNDTWQGHQTHLDQHILQPALSLPDGHGEKFHQHMSTWSQNLGKYYTALTSFTNVLNTGATKMGSLDKDTGRHFTPDS